MLKQFHRYALVGGLALGAVAMGAAAMAAPEPTAPGRPGEVGNPSRTPGDPTPPTGSTTAPGTRPDDVKRPAGDMPRPDSPVPGSTTTDPARPATTSPDPASPSGILNERDIPGRAATLSPTQVRNAQKALMELHKVNALEIAIGALARERAASEEVRNYARELVESHQASDRKLQDYATSHGLTLGPGSSAASERQPSPSVSDMTAPPRATSPASERTGRPDQVAVPGAGTGNPSSGAVAGTVASPSTTGTTAPPSNTGPGAVATERAGNAGPTGAGSALDISPAPELDAEGRRTVAKLQKLDGEAFDRAFLTAMVKDHSKTLAKIRTFERQQKESDMSGLLGEARSMVEHHLQRARELQRPGSTANPGSPRPLGAL